MIDARIDWNGGLAGGFTFGMSKFGGSDPFTSAWSATFDGPYDDVSQIVQSVEWDRGRDDLITSMLAGTGTLTVRDEDGLFNPANPASPLAGLLIPMRPVYVTLPDDDGVVRNCLRMFTQDEPTHDASQIPAVTSFDLVDAYVVLDGVNPTIASTGPITTGAAIGLVLDAAGLTDPSFRSLDDGDLIPGFSADGTASALSLITSLLDAERGMFFVNNAGVCVFRDRHSRYERTSATTIDGTFSPPLTAGGAPVQNLINRQNVTGLDGITQQFLDNNSRLANGYRDGGDINTSFISVATQSAELARHIVKRSLGVRPLGTFTVDSIGDGFTQALVREVGDVFTVPTDGAPTGTKGDFYIEGISGRYEGAKLTMNWRVSKRTTLDTAFRFGISRFAGADPFRY